jgi:putative ABC transport system permease protein
MKLDEMKYSIKNIWSRKIRSFLTSLSILIGVMSVFVIVSFGLGLNHYVNTIAAEAGVDKLYVQAASLGAPGTDNTFAITTSDINFISKIKGIKEIAGMYMSPGKIEYKEDKLFAFVTGFDMDKQKFIDEAFTVSIESGRSLKDDETGKAMLGYNYQIKDKAFTRAVKQGDKMEINDVSFEVVGFYEEIGNPSDDVNIYLSDKGFETLFPENKDKYGFVMIQAESSQNVSQLAEKINEKFRKYRGEEEGKETFHVQTFEDALAVFSSVTNIILIVLILIAAISIFVATVNIMNTMYTAVLERTKEIGTMKAVGARNSEILFMFIFESGVIGFIGGVFGVILGYLLASFGGNLLDQLGYSMLIPIFPWQLFAACIIFASVVGAAAGVLPAKQAADQKPVDALRYE